MTSDEVELLKGWIDEKLGRRDERYDELRRDVDTLRTSVVALERDVADFKQVTQDLREVAHHLDQVKDAFGPLQALATFAMSKKTWAAVATVMFVVNWIADHVAVLDRFWPF